jgi:Na+-translocating ferredoxin:NAD+ oxidoreductase subunit B
VQSTPALADKIDALLPQTQCQRCGFPDCRAYAEAVAKGEAALDRCPRGDDSTIAALAGLLHEPVTPLDPEVSTFAPSTVAVIEEPFCIGSTKCIQACPVDAIAGAARQMHIVIEALCTGCGLCLLPCPVDCIRLEPAEGVTKGLEGWHFPMAGRDRADALRDRYGMFKRRRRETAGLKAATRVRGAGLKAHRQAEIAAALTRERTRHGTAP